MKRFLLTLTAVLFASTSFAQIEHIPETARNTMPLDVGDQIPEVALSLINGIEITTKRILQAAPTVFVFYRGGWCPFCNRHLAQLFRVQPELVKLGYQLVALSPDKPSILEKSLNKHNYSFMLVSDSKMYAARGFGVAYRLKQSEYEELKSKGIDLEESSGEDHHLLPVVSIFVADQSGKIKYVYSNPDFRTKLDEKKLLESLSK